MHHSNEVSIHFPDTTSRDGSPAGVGWLVEPGVVVMRLPGRGATPGQPSHVTVPASSGGGRGEDISVIGLYDSDVLEEWVALQLDHDTSLPISGEVPDGLDLSVLSVSDFSATTASLTSDEGSRGTLADDSVVLDGWVCRCFPRLPGCR